MDENEVLVLKGNSTTLSTERKRNHEKSLGNCVCDGIDIYIMMAHNTKIFFFIRNIWLENIGEVQVMNLL